MGAINRYTNLSTSQFNPLNFQEIMAIPMYKQKKHNELQNYANTMGLFDVKSLDVDNNFTNKSINEYQNKVNTLVSELNKNGFNQDIKNKLIDLNKEKQLLTSSNGNLGKVQNAYNSYQQNLKEQQKLYNTGKISKDKFERGIYNALQEYKGVEEQSIFQPFTGVHDEDITGEARKIALDIQKNPKHLESFGLTKKGNRYYDVKTGRDFTQKGAISYAIQSILGQNSNIISDLQQRGQLGLLGNNTPEQYLKNLGDTHEVFYSKDKTTKSQSGFFDPLEIHNAKKALDQADENDDIPYVMKTFESSKIRNLSFIDKLSNKKKVFVDRKISDFSGGLAPIVGTTDNTLNVDSNSSYKSLNNVEKDRYNILEKKLQLEGKIPFDNKLGSNRNSMIISDYLNSFSELDYSAAIIKPNSTSNSVEAGLLLNTKDVNKMNANIKQDINLGAIKLWDENGNTTELKSGETAEYVGILSPNNKIDKFKSASKDQTVSPHVYQIYDKDKEFIKNVYASRSKFEREQPGFQAGRTIKNVTLRAERDEPGLSHQYNTIDEPYLSKQGITDYTVKYNPDSQTYDLIMNWENGQQAKGMGITKRQFMDVFYDQTGR